MVEGVPVRVLAWLFVALVIITAINPESQWAISTSKSFGTLISLLPTPESGNRKLQIQIEGFGVNRVLCVSSLFHSFAMLRPSAESELVRLSGDLVADPDFYIAICVTAVFFFDQ
jgi:hypothetical protein